MVPGIRLTKAVLLLKLEPSLRIPIRSNSIADELAGGKNIESPKTIMICDDEPDVLRAYQIALKMLYNVVTAKSGGECIQKYQEVLRTGNKVHAIVLDYRLGDMSGDDVARKVRALGGTKVILISAYEIENPFVEDLKREGSIAIFLKKPFRLSTLISTIEFIISR